MDRWTEVAQKPTSSDEVELGLYTKTTLYDG